MDILIPRLKMIISVTGVLTKGLLLATDVSTNCVEAIFRDQLLDSELKMYVVLLGSNHFLRNINIVCFILKVKDGTSHAYS